MSSASDDGQEYHIYGPGTKDRVLYEINKDYKAGIIRVAMGHSMVSHRDEIWHSLLVKRFKKGINSMFDMHDERG